MTRKAEERRWRRAEKKAAKESLARYKKILEIAAAREAVVKAAMGSFKRGYITNTCSNLHAACAALAKLEGK